MYANTTNTIRHNCLRLQCVRTNKQQTYSCNIPFFIFFLDSLVETPRHKLLTIICINNIIGFQTNTRFIGYLHSPRIKTANKTACVHKRICQQAKSSTTAAGVDIQVIESPITIKKIHGRHLRTANYTKSMLLVNQHKQSVSILIQY